MNRKLQHTFKALSATAAVFTVLLLAGGPAPAIAPSLRLTTNPAALLDASGGTTVDASIDAGIDTPVGASELAQPSAVRRRHMRHSRELLALPYFSFAQGLRRNRS